MTHPVPVSCKTSTPWGTADYAYHHARGVIFYTTPGHGGYKVSLTKALQMPPALAKMGMNWGGALWFEEDCQYAAVPLAFPELFSAEQVEQAKQSLLNWSHEAYEEFCGVVLTAEQSRSKAEALFKQENLGKLVVFSAQTETPEMVKVYARELVERYRGGGQEWAFLVPAAEYAKRSLFGFVIEPGNIRRWRFRACNLAQN